MRNEAIYPTNSDLYINIRALTIYYSELKLNESLKAMLSELRVLVNNKTQSNELEKKHQEFLSAYKKYISG